MRIAHFTNTYVPTVSGVVRNVVNLQQSLTRLGNQVFVFTENRPDSRGEDPLVYRYPTLGSRLNMDFPAIFPYSPTLDRFLLQLQPDIIHTHHPFMLGHAALAKGRRLGIPVVFTFHTLYWEHAHYIPVPFAQNLVRKIIERRVSKFVKVCDRVIVYTENLKEALHNRYGLDDRISVVPTAIDRTPFQNSKKEEIRAKFGWNNDPILISVGRLGREKNWYTFLEAGIQARAAFPGLRIVILGDGPDRRDLEMYVERRDASGYITFLGRIPFNECPKYFQAADIFGFASVTETMGRVTLEAIAAGLPVVAVDAPGTSAIVNHGCEGLLTPNDSSALAEAFILLLRDENLRRRFGRAGKEKAKTFQLDREAAMTLDVYEQAIAEQKFY